MDLIPANNVQLKTWLLDLAGNIAISGADVALLDAQITHLQNQCAAFAPARRPAKETGNTMISQSQLLSRQQKE